MTQRDGAVERRRLSALSASGLLEMGEDEAFGRLTRLAARLCGAPIARVSLVDSDRQVFKSVVGPLPPSGRETPLSHSICRHVAYGRTALVVTDARRDPLVAGSGAVLEHGVRAYAGEPLFSADGECLGALCVVDERPREWTADELAALRDLAAAANSEIHLRASLKATEAAAGRLAEQAGLLELAPDAVFVRRAADDVLTFWNTGARRLYGFDAEQALGRTPTALFAARGQVEASLIRAALERDGCWEGELRHEAADGREVIVLSRQALQRNAEREPHVILEIDTDVTRRRDLEQRLRQVEKLEATGRLAGGVAHDFNDVVTAISGCCALAREATGGAVAELDEIARAARRAGQLTGQLLAFSRRQVLEPTELELGEVARELIPMLRRLVGEDVEITLRSGDEPARVRADRAQLEQVIVNLALNAHEAMPNGGTLTIHTRLAERSERFTRADAGSDRGARVWLVVSDSGVGIAPELVAHVFEPSFTTKGSGRGTGLGLTTVQRIVTQSGGDVWIESRPGSGTTVTVALPAARPIADRTAAPNDEDAEQLDGTETILLCEDEDPVQRLVERLLSRHGYTVLSAAHPLDALKLAAAHAGRIDALISDVMMPYMRGPELAQQLRANRRGMHALFVSGHPADRLRSLASFPPDSTFVQKPFATTELLAALRNLLDHDAPTTTSAPDVTT